MGCRRRAGRVWAGGGRATAWGAARHVGCAWTAAGGRCLAGRAAAFPGRQRRFREREAAAGEGAGEGERGGDG
jgi:hypothetical protein